MTIDEQLLKRVLSEDKQALELLVDRYHLILWRVCWKRSPDPVICERLVTHVFQQLWKQPQNFAGEQKLVFLLVACCKKKLDELNAK